MSARGYLRGYTERGIGFDLGTQTSFLQKPSAAAEAFLDARYPRSEDGTRWVNKRALARKGVSLVRSVTSGAAPPEVVERRRLSCFGDSTSPACDALERTDRGMFCAACGCGRRAIARLDGEVSKLSRAYVECPKGRAGFSNEVRR